MSVKVLKKSAGVDTSELTNIFNKLMGVEDPTPEIAIPKYNKLKKASLGVVRFLQSLTEQDSFFRKVFGDFFNVELEQIRSYESDIKTIFEKQFENEEEELPGYYLKIKTDEKVKQIIIMCGFLSRYKKYIEDKNNFDTTFVAREPGIELKLFPFSDLDFKSIFVNHPNSDSKVRTYMCFILSTLFAYSKDAYEVISSPDVDTDHLADLLIQAIGAMRKQIPRCDDAFDKIESSVQMLRNNMNNYYKDFLQSSNPNTILESFISDVATKEEDNEKHRSRKSVMVMFQFRKITNHIKNKASQMKSNPHVSKLFNVLDQSIDKLEESNKQ